MSVSTLAGCRPRPLAAYLRSLAVLRLVGEQADPEVRGWWKDDVFHLAGRLGRDELVDFFARSYRPSPILAPWNGGSGFHPKDRQEAIAAVRASASDRFAGYRAALGVADAELARPGSDDKATLVRRLRSRLPDDALAWLDAVLVLGGDSLGFPPLLGSGGNDGRLEFTNTFLHYLVALIDPASGEPASGSAAAVASALFDDAVPGLASGPIGQFQPGAAGGPNGTTGFSGGEASNPWSFVLALEGALTFSASLTRRDEVGGPGLSYPFTVRSLTAGGSGGLATADVRTARGEMWLPLWSRPARPAEIARLFGEGRFTVGRRIARDGLDVARAIASFGADRGLDAFERVAFHQRYGRTYLATSQGRFPVPPSPRVDLAADLDRDEWLSRIKRLAAGEEGTGALAAGLRRLTDALFDIARGRGPLAVQQALVALGSLHRLVAASKGLRERLPPVRPLGAEWAEAAGDGTSEVELAQALASLGGHAAPLRWNLYPLLAERARRPSWDPDSVHTVSARGLDDLLLRVASRRALWLADERFGRSSLEGLRPARTPALCDLLAGELDPRRLMELVYGLSLVRPGARRPPPAARRLPVPAGFALVGSFLAPDRRTGDGGEHEQVEHEGERDGDPTAQPAATEDVSEPSARRASWILSRLAAAPTPAAWEEVIERCRVWYQQTNERRLDARLAPPGPGAARRWTGALLVPLAVGDRRRLAARLEAADPHAAAQEDRSTPDREGASA